MATAMAAPWWYAQWYAALNAIQAASGLPPQHPHAGPGQQALMGHPPTAGGPESAWARSAAPSPLAQAPPIPGPMSGRMEWTCGGMAMATVTGPVAEVLALLAQAAAITGPTSGTAGIPPAPTRADPDAGAPRATGRGRSERRATSRASRRTTRSPPPQATLPPTPPRAVPAGGRDTPRRSRRSITPPPRPPATGEALPAAHTARDRRPRSRSSKQGKGKGKGKDKGKGKSTGKGKGKGEGTGTGEGKGKGTGTGEAHEAKTAETADAQPPPATAATRVRASRPTLSAKDAGLPSTSFKAAIAQFATVCAHDSQPRCVPTVGGEGDDHDLYKSIVTAMSPTLGDTSINKRAKNLLQLCLGLRDLIEARGTVLVALRQLLDPKTYAALVYYMCPDADDTGPTNYALHIPQAAAMAVLTGKTVHAIAIGTSSETGPPPTDRNCYAYTYRPLATTRTPPYPNHAAGGRRQCPSHCDGYRQPPSQNPARVPGQVAPAPHDGRRLVHPAS